MKVQTLKRTLTVASSSFVVDSPGAGSTTWTLNFTAAHNLYVGDVLSFIDPYYPEQIDATVSTVVAGGGADTTLANARGITFVLTNRPKVTFPAKIQTDIFRVNGDTDVFTFSFRDAANGLIHAVGYDGVTASALLSYSLDGVTWKALGTATAMSGSIAEIAPAAAYVYGKVTISAIAGVSAVADKVKIYRSGC